MSNEIKSILDYQTIDEELFKAEKEFGKNPDNIVYVKAVKKIQSMAETLEAYEKKAQALLEKFNSLLSQKESFIEEKTQLEKTVEESTELTAVDYLKKQISLLMGKLDALKTSLEEIEKEIQLVNGEYIAFAKEIKEAKEFGKNYKETFDKLSEELKAKKKETATKLKAIEGNISAEFLEKYKSKRADKKINFPLVRDCDGKNCSLCGMELSMVVKSKISTDSVIECENCHKFVYLKK